MASRHDWNAWDHYQSIHDKRIQDFDHFIVENRLIAVPTTNKVVWQGTLLCGHGIEIHVHKVQDKRTRPDGQPEVRTVRYKYQAMRRENDRVVTLVRYDNSEHHGQPDPHHRHGYDAQGGQIDPPEHVGEDSWPTLGDVIQEVHDKWGSED
jgi:Family of unknown function (DUF6516)